MSWSEEFPFFFFFFFFVFQPICPHFWSIKIPIGAHSHPHTTRNEFCIHMCVVPIHTSTLNSSTLMSLCYHQDHLWSRVSIFCPKPNSLFTFFPFIWSLVFSLISGKMLFRSCLLRQVSTKAKEMRKCRIVEICCYWSVSMIVKRMPGAIGQKPHICWWPQRYP